MGRNLSLSNNKDSMKRLRYQKPNMEVIEISPYLLLASSVGIDGSSQGDFSEDLVRERHRGTWGNLWENDKD